MTLPFRRNRAAQHRDTDPMTAAETTTRKAGLGHSCSLQPKQWNISAKRWQVRSTVPLLTAQQVLKRSLRGECNTKGDHIAVKFCYFKRQRHLQPRLNSASGTKQIPFKQNIPHKWCFQSHVLWRQCKRRKKKDNDKGTRWLFVVFDLSREVQKSMELHDHVAMNML